MSRFTLVRPVHNIRHGWHLFRNRRTLLQMLREVFAGTYRMSVVTTLIAILGIAYIVFPFDLIPDYIPVLGWIDDGLVAYLVLKTLVKETQRYNRRKAIKRKPAGFSRVE